MACSSLIESGLWSRDAVERQMSHQERNSVRLISIRRNIWGAQVDAAVVGGLSGCESGEGLVRLILKITKIFFNHESA
jgi:hypothetical protein